ncbi:ATP-dependent DNA helicase sgs1 [Modicella reniformis]|uniref:DNA 3'-5' helicase n=1 Tax=Modicella reniformis TaxID=1440133 RepID=A0A9P6IYU4_9FUNG|nr:ATP-dependent DNA helicase sgs1 [Modicella reniformis]
MTPESIFKSNTLTRLWKMEGWKQRLETVVLGEAHCVSEWGQDFRPEYARIGKLRPMLHHRVAFVALSATLSSTDIKKLRATAEFRPDVNIINVGNDRSNVMKMKNYARSFKDLDFVVKDMKKTIVYFETRFETQRALCHLRPLLDLPDRGKVAAFHACKSDGIKELYMDKFRRVMPVSKEFDGRANQVLVQ